VAIGKRGVGRRQREDPELEAIRMVLEVLEEGEVYKVRGH
jgi:hypothetical protein